MSASILFCIVTHKPLFGNTFESLVSSKDLDHFVLRNLQCGKHYDVSTVCYNSLGPGQASDLLRDVRTLGQKPVVPSRPTDFVHPTNVSVRLDLFLWNDDNCPIEYFVVSYKRTQVSPGTVLKSFPVDVKLYPLKKLLHAYLGYNLILHCVAQS